MYADIFQLLLTPSQTVMAPLAALTMAAVLLVYARTSIKAAKLNAQKHREADGGQISWHNENRRRHGQMDRVDNDRATFTEALAADFGRKSKGSKEEAGNATRKVERSAGDEKLRKILGKDE